MAQRRCYGYDIGLNGQVTINPDEATVVRWIFERYLHGDSLGKIASALEAKTSAPPLASPNGTGRHSTNCCPMKNTQDGYCSRKRSALV